MRELDGCLLFPSYALRFCPHLNGNRSSHPIESQDSVYLTLAEMGYVARIVFFGAQPLRHSILPTCLSQSMKRRKRCKAKKLP